MKKRRHVVLNCRRGRNNDNKERVMESFCRNQINVSLLLSFSCPSLSLPQLHSLLLSLYYYYESLIHAYAANLPRKRPLAEKGTRQLLHATGTCGSRGVKHTSAQIRCQTLITAIPCCSVCQKSGRGGKTFFENECTRIICSVQWQNLSSPTKHGHTSSTVLQINQII